jgi:hypothetical protein
MMFGDAEVVCVARIRRNIRQALEQWDSSNPDAMSDCQAILQQSVVAMLEFREGISTDSAPAAEMRRALLDIKASIDRFVRVVDAASAFVSGIPGLIADQGISYDAAGTARHVGVVDSIMGEGKTPCRIF